MKPEDTFLQPPANSSTRQEGEPEEVTKPETPEALAEKSVEKPIVPPEEAERLKAIAEAGVSGEKLWEQFQAEIFEITPEGKELDAVERLQPIKDNFERISNLYPDLKADVFDHMTGEVLTPSQRIKLFFDRATARATAETQKHNASSKTPQTGKPEATEQNPTAEAAAEPRTPQEKEQNEAIPTDFESGMEFAQRLLNEGEIEDIVGNIHDSEIPFVLEATMSGHKYEIVRSGSGKGYTGNLVIERDGIMILNTVVEKTSPQ